jgi:beta-lactamase class A
MSISDNAATNILIDRVGQDRVNATMRDLGMANSMLGRKMLGRPVPAGDPENWATPDDYATLMAAILADRAASPAACAQIIALLEKQQNPRRIARHLPTGTRWGSKTGSLTGAVNDVGFIDTKSGLLIVAAFCANPTDPHAGEAIIGDLARAALSGA